MKKLFFLLLLFTFGLGSQDKTTQKPLKHESGDVVIVASDAADYYNRKNMQELKKIRISILNYYGEEEYKKLLNGYIAGQIAYNSRSWLEARRSFEENHRQIQDETRKLVDMYKKKLEELARESASFSVELNLTSGGYAEDYKNVVNKHTKNANGAMNEADSLVETGNLDDAIYYYKSAMSDFLKVMYYANKSKYQGMTPAQKAEKNIFIDDDYIPEKFFKDLDDSKNELFTIGEEKRKKSRDYVKKILNIKIGESNNTSSPPAVKEDKKENTTAKDKTK